MNYSAKFINYSAKFINWIPRSFYVIFQTRDFSSVLTLNLNFETFRRKKYLDSV